MGMPTGNLASPAEAPGRGLVLGDDAVTGGRMAVSVFF